MMFCSSTWLLYLAGSAVVSQISTVSATAIPSHTVRSTVDDWASVASSTTLQWTPCFENYTCAKLEVPLDYGDPSRGNTSIAISKYTAQNQRAETQNVVFKTGIDAGAGGPGGVNSGRQIIRQNFVISDGQALSELLGGQHNIVGIDGRAVGHSGPTVDCWPGHPEQRAQFEKLYYPFISYASSVALETQFYAADIFGQACTSTVGGSNGNASFISTPAVARDMLTYIQAEQVAAGKPADDAKLTYWGLSYGTVLGVTFASMFPDKVDRMIVDGVLDASDYYDLAWKQNLFETDEAIKSFSQYCYQGGPQNCSFWGPSAANISDRFDSLLAELKYNPIPIPSSEACEIPLLATYSDLKQYALEALYTPLMYFPILADVLSSLEAGNTTDYLAAVMSGSIPADPCNNGTIGSTIDTDTLIKCVDGYGGTKYATLEEYRAYVETLTYESEVFGEVWPNNANTVACRSFDVEIPEAGKLAASIMEPRNTLFPILFVTADIDPVTPKRNAYKMSSVFPGSVVLTQNSVRHFNQHTASARASSCLLEAVQAYLGGQLPPANTTCQPDVLPFQGSSGLVAFA
ncbi:hypothetical protein UA08_04053 [Talaromyces atroroseus]|uniref:Peptidase S33 tripeptidyl aminopeptidase-like C-terminal domain-containing protein n=1 Tax=Talaromyces atroroseus TaxID=1441469 RepID=A0A1Q5Q934_TALAT|nr:hypothetical protein UA08_04053 [Talaromyces atroroseus]OKL60646.1 hypothetical protein UA08_04053 [Talaromyces atroroseus]